MPRSGISGTLRSPQIDVVIDTGNPFLNRTVDGFLKIGAVGACKVAAEETFDCLHRGDVSKRKVEHALKKMCKEGAYWGTVAGVYVGVVYGVERVRGRSDWKNAMVGGALSGALVSAASSNHGDKIVKDAITAGAVATAVEFANYLT
ncbi:Outer envelope pore protein 16-1, chloroplastic [Zea mays]|uniref:Outer envelope pore protein 16-1, chloroplastic n=3 Tax=Zea mays TaxID=4577 RepID=A0A3L6DM51_MAIZE|nr:outer envelope pore protein 16, chloroplastic [Zea mays]AQK95516.1 Putative mitochondrial import inner membrane translocase subunit Tim17 family protein [Zea mays]AQK95517.1 Putative mitochondrial import inner membrane translocase subunit Tim17 family protein [Zea mays]PWZ09645.1 Outer envelope pore protein 16-1, chloroplastic [Zea mays]|eukprot:XP_008656555.1 outer envelope pore protein 16, chloroplastic [Zea mays]